jgi:hypothetical protein
MPKNKDLKREVRARMLETGERYTEARSAIAPDRSRTDEAPPPPPETSVRALVIDQVDGEFAPVADGPISRFYEFPRYPDVGLNWSSGFEAAQRLFVSQGLLGGWFRTWLRDATPEHAKATIAIHALEFTSRTGPTRHVESFANRTIASTRLRIVADPPVAAFVDPPSEDGVAKGWAWIAGAHREACVITTGPADEVEARLRRLVHAQATTLLRTAP